MLLTNFLLVGLSTLATYTIATPCKREAMYYGTNYYVWSQTQGQIGVMPVIDSVPYTENRKPADFLNGVIFAPSIKLDWNATFYDSTTCTAFAELVAAEPGNEYIIGMRLEFKAWEEAGEKPVEGEGDLVITKLDSVVTRPGDWFFNASSTLRYIRAEKPWSVIPPAKRDSRTTLKAAADAYADVFSNRSSPVPFATPCCRIEGGFSTCANANETNLNTCSKGIPDGNHPIALKNRTYVIDEEYGVVQVSMDFAGLADSHMFRIEEGKIRAVHTMTDCGKAGCASGNATVSWRNQQQKRAGSRNLRTL